MEYLRLSVPEPRLRVPEIPEVRQLLIREGPPGKDGKKGEKGEPGDSHIFTANSHLEFPPVGDVRTLYISSGDNRSYRFDENSLKYICVGSDYEEITIIDGGIRNE